ncbi:MAG: hypothetical protein QM645_06355 [Asticcacaulis sp.]
MTAVPAMSQTISTGMMYDGQEIRRTEGVTSLVMNGHKLELQSDGNLCLKTVQNGHRWCVNDHIGANYQQVSKVVFQRGVLKVLDANGKQLWATRNVADPYAKLVITPQGKLQTTSSVGALYWENP